MNNIIDKENQATVVENNQPVPCCPAQKSLFFRVIVIFLGILIVIGLFLNAYLMFFNKETVNKPPDISLTATPTPTPDINANWITYTNPTYGYSIKFPNTYEVPPQTEKQKTQLGTDNNICITLKGDTIKDGTTCLFIIDYWQKTIVDVIKMKLPTDGSQPQDYTSGTIKGKIIVYKMGESTTQAVVILPKPSTTNEIITLSYTNYPGDIERSKLVDQILSTFKFLD